MRQVFRSAFRVTQPFNARPEYYSQFGLKGHEGIDIIPTGSDWSILCLEDGVVVKDEDNSMSGAYGIYVTIWHPQLKKATQYCHLTSNNVKLNDEIKKGQLIGKMGDSGNTSGAHLHLNLYEVNDDGVRLNKNNGYNGGINPEGFLVDTQQIIDELRMERDKNWDSYKDALSQLARKDERIMDLEGQVNKLNEENTGLKTQILDVTNQVRALAEQIKKMADSDATAIDEGIKAQSERNALQGQLDEIRRAFGVDVALPHKALLETILERNTPNEEVVKQIIPIMDQLWQNVRKGKPQGVVNKVVKFIVNIFVRR